MKSSIHATLSLPLRDGRTLASIASQCPLTGGSAVFKARSLLSVVSDAKYDDDELCNPRGGGDGHKALKKLDETGAYQVFPNPAQNELTVMLPKRNLAGDKGEIVIHNAVGTKVLELDVPADTTSFNFDVSKLTDGPVLVSFYDDGKLIGAERVLIIH